MYRLIRHFFSTQTVLRLQLAVIGSATALAVLAIILTATLLDRGVESAAQRSDNALAVSNNEAILSDMLGILASQVNSYLASEAFFSLDPSSQRVARAELLRNDAGPLDPALVPAEIAVSLKDGVALQKSMDSLVSKTLQALSDRETADAVRARGQLGETGRSLQLYFEQPTVTNFHVFASTYLAFERTTGLSSPPSQPMQSKTLRLWNIVSTLGEAY